jgi:DNA-binding response OmpR family regulator
LNGNKVYKFIGVTLKKFKALYLEDDILIQENTIDFIEEFFDTIYAYDDGKKALEGFKKLNPDILLLDVNTPILNGLEFAKIVRKIDKDIPIIFMTAFEDKEFLHKAIEVRASGYLVKPFDIEKLRFVILEALNSLDNNLTIELNYDFIWNKYTKELFYNSKKINTTMKENQIISILIDNKDKYITAIDIAYIINSKNSKNEENNIVKLISRLKSKVLKETNQEYFFILTKYKGGYKI